MYRFKKCFTQHNLSAMDSELFNKSRSQWTILYTCTVKDFDRILFSDTDFCSLSFSLLGNGYYIYLESSSPAVQGDTASLLSKTFPGNTDVCLSFFYNSYGQDAGAVELSIEVGSVLSIYERKSYFVGLKLASI